MTFDEMAGAMGFDFARGGFSSIQDGHDRGDWGRRPRMLQPEEEKMVEEEEEELRSRQQWSRSDRLGRLPLPSRTGRPGDSHTLPSAPPSRDTVPTGRHLPPSLHGRDNRDSALHRPLSSSSRAHSVASLAASDDYGPDDYEALLELDNDVKTRGVSNAKLRDFPVSRIKKQFVGQRCLVCQQSFGPTSQVMTLPCNHYFHVDCVSTWFASQRTCPTCRQVLED